MEQLINKVQGALPMRGKKPSTVTEPAQSSSHDIFPPCLHFALADACIALGAADSAAMHFAHPLPLHPLPSKFQFHTFPHPPHTFVSASMTSRAADSSSMRLSSSAWRSSFTSFTSAITLRRGNSTSSKQATGA